MKKRQWAIIAGVLVLMLAFAVNRWLASTKQPTKPTKPTPLKGVEVTTIQNTAVPINIMLNGKLSALKKIDLFAEVSGVLMAGNKRFEEGITYNQGEVLLRLNADEAEAAYLAAKDQYINQITQTLPDIKLDYPKEFDTWQTYLNAVSSNTRTTAPPKPEDPQLNLFLTGRGIYSSYQNLSSAKTRLDKFIIYAPFTGILTEALVEPGMLVRAGQPLGEFIAPNEFELEATAAFNQVSLISLGDAVSLNSQDAPGNWTGTVVRKNAKVDPATQQVKVFVKVSGKGLTDGMYMSGALTGDSITNAVSIARNLVYNQAYTFIVNADSTLKKAPVTVVQKGAEEFTITGLPNGTLLPKKPIVGAYEGMKVAIIKQN